MLRRRPNGSVWLSSSVLPYAPGSANMSVRDREATRPRFMWSQQSIGSGAAVTGKMTAKSADVGGRGRTIVESGSHL